MNPDKFGSDLKQAHKRNRGLSLIVATLSIAVLCSLVIIINIVGTQRTIVVPPSMNKSFWVTNSTASAEYLEQMGAFISWLILDVSPATIDWKKDMLLSYVEADQYAAMKTRQDIEAVKLRRINATTYFLPQQLVPSEDKQSVMVRGRLRTLINGQETSTENKAYLVQFQYAGGRVHLQTFKEIPNDKTFAQTVDSGVGGVRPN